MNIDIDSPIRIEPDTIAFDIDPRYGIVCLRAEGDEMIILLNGRRWRSWQQAEKRIAPKIKWLDGDHVIIYPEVAIVSLGGFFLLERSWPSLCVVANQHLLIGYDEEAIYGARDDEPEAEGASLYTRDGHFEIGFTTLFYYDREADFDEVTSCYSFEDTFVFISGLHYWLWILDATSRRYRHIVAPFSLVPIKVMAGDSKTACAVLDNRFLKSLGYGKEYPNAFDLAVFDLVAGTAEKRDFAPVAAALVAAGFHLDELTFQPNARGRIIVRDAEKAALLEISNGKV